MRIRSPVSRGSFALRFAVLDLVCALIAPGLVLWLRGAQILLSPDPSALVQFWGISFFAALVSFLAFRIRDGLTHLFSVHDALDVGKAVIMAELLTAFVMFSATRLDGIPRSVLIIHALLLLAGLVGVRGTVRMLSVETRFRSADTEHVLFFGANKLTSLYMEFLRTYAPGRYEIVGVLDDGHVIRSVGGVRVLGRTDHFAPIVQEFREHGIVVTRAIVGSDAEAFSDDERTAIEQACQEFGIQLNFVPALIGLAELTSRRPEVSLEERSALVKLAGPKHPSYAPVKRSLDIFVGLILCVAVAPLLPIVAGLVLLDIGSPVLFWQRRLGLNGRSFQLYKFRTLKPSYDRFGAPVPDSRISWVGHFLRRLRLDELPQLLNVLIGDMSLVGPRPLLPKDQPADPALRLSVRPGITGWAQVNGGTLLSPDEKNAFDEWYVGNMSFWVDLVTVWRTILFVFRGERANETRVEPTNFAGVSEDLLASEQNYRVAAE